MIEENGNFIGNDVFKKILSNYQKLEESLIAQLDLLHNHGTTIGTLRETIWQGVFEQIIPKKFVIQQSVFIIDSNAEVSKEVDLAIMDEIYTPYIFQYGKIKFVPIEAVAVVIECKSNNPNKDGLILWSETIDKLNTNKESIARLAFDISSKAVPTQQSTRPIKMLCVKELGTEIEAELSGSYFDFILSINKDRKLKVNYATINREDSTNEEQNDLKSWYKELNFHKERCNEENIRNIGELDGINLEHYEIPGSSILSLNFQLNQLLMLINNPMPFPHLAYAQKFKEIKLSLDELEE